MHLFLFANLACVAVVSAKNIHKRNAYGDELIVPDEVVVDAQPQVAQVYGEEEVAVVDEAYGKPAVPVIQVEESGYRMKRATPPARRVKRSNAYGDELIVPDVAIEDTLAAQQVYEETAPIVAEIDPYGGQALASAVAAPVIVQRGGYRQKRNAYGDELIVPDVAVESAAVPVIAEEEVAEIDQGYVGSPVNAAVAAVGPVVAEVQPSGYRLKRNLYGDELIVPAALGAHVPAVQYSEVAPVAITQPLYGRRPYSVYPYIINQGFKARRAAAAARKFAARKLH